MGKQLDVGHPGSDRAAPARARARAPHTTTPRDDARAATSMGYVPPHLRGAGGASDGAAGAAGAPRDGGGAREWDGARRASDARDGDRRAPTGDRGGSARADGARMDRAPVFATWRPSARVEALTEAQTTEIRERLGVTVEIEEGEAAVPSAIESFEDMTLARDIMADIRYREYDKPSPIQAQAIPVILSGRDVLGCAETGSGKTAAFSIPMIQHALNQAPLRQGDGPYAIVMAPTRELAQQIEAEAKTFTRSSKGFRTAIIVGGTNMSEQRGALRSGVQIVVATPGRLIDHLQQGNTNLSRVSFVVLDEADRMLDMGFEPQIREVLMNLPKPHQTLLFSATMPSEVEALASDYLHKPVKVKVGTTSAPTANVSQHLEKVVDAEKVDRLVTMLIGEQREAMKLGQDMPMTVIFVERKNRADEIAELLNAENVPAAALHGGRSQGEREAALHDYKTGRCSVLVATDVAARGLDVKGVAHVVNLDLPRNFEDYVHRIGRTGRAGMSGRSTSFYTDRDSFIVAQIKRALLELEAGNAFAFATGREARAKEREEAKAWREGRTVEPSVVETDGGVTIAVEDKFKHMIVSAPAAASGGGAGAADAAFGSDSDDDW